MNSHRSWNLYNLSLVEGDACNDMGSNRLLKASNKQLQMNLGNYYLSGEKVEIYFSTDT